MAYEPTQWKTGDVVTSAKLNKLENAVANSAEGSILKVNNLDGTLDKTWQEIYNAFLSGTVVVTYEDIGQKFTQMVLSVGKVNENYIVTLNLSNNAYQASSADGYPVFIQS